MNMKQLFSVAILISVFATVPSFGMQDGGNQPEQNQPQPDQNQNNNNNEQQPAGPGWKDTLGAPFYFAYGEMGGFCKNVKGMTWGNENTGRFETTKNLKLFWYGAGAMLVARYVYDNMDAIKEALGLCEDQSEDAQVFADSACGCEEAEEEKDGASEDAACSLEAKKAEVV